MAPLISAWPARLKDSETGAGLISPLLIAMDGIAVIVNSANTVSNLGEAHPPDLLPGEVTDWTAVQ